MPNSQTINKTRTAQAMLSPILRPILPIPEQHAVDIIDQTALPHSLHILRLTRLDEVVHAISHMQVRGAPLIGVTASFGLAFAARQDASDEALAKAASQLLATRPTAVNLQNAIARLQSIIRQVPLLERAELAWQTAWSIMEEDILHCRQIGEHGLSLLAPLRQKNKRLNIMTHCNAGALATSAFGTALAPVYAAFNAGWDVHVWVSETRPRNQGLLTAWELAQHGVPHTLIADNAAGYLMTKGEVDALIVGADRIAANGDVANKIGTYLKALAAKAAQTPFYVAAPQSTLDFACRHGDAISIEVRAADELGVLHGVDTQGTPAHVRQFAANSAVCNPAFDVTPAALVSALITERGICAASSVGLAELFPEARL